MVKVIGVDDEESLYLRYQGQFKAQQCYIEFDTVARTLMAVRVNEIGIQDVIPASDGCRRYEIPAMTNDAAYDLMQKIVPFAEVILKNENKQNEKARRAVQDAVRAIQKLCEKSEYAPGRICEEHPNDFFQNVSNKELGIVPGMSEEDINILYDKLESNDYINDYGNRIIVDNGYLREFIERRAEEANNALEEEPELCKDESGSRGDIGF